MIQLRHRIFGIVLLVVGVALFVSGIRGTLPLGTSMGALLCLTGAVLLGVSFVGQPPLPLDAPPPLSPYERLTGIFKEPSRVFGSLRTHPKWLLPFVIIILCAALYNLAFTQKLEQEVITGAAIDKTLEGRLIPRSQLEAIKRQQVEQAKSPLSRVAQVIGQASSLFLFMTLIAGLYVLGMFITGGLLNFWSALSVALYATLPPALIHTSLSLIILFVMSADEIHPLRGQRGLMRDNLGVLFSPDAHPVLYTVASFFGVVSFYGLWLMAKGLRNATVASSAAGAWAVALAIWGLNLCFNVALAVLYPKFI